MQRNRKTKTSLEILKILLKENKINSASYQLKEMHYLINGYEIIDYITKMNLKNIKKFTDILAHTRRQKSFYTIQQIPY